MHTITHHGKLVSRNTMLFNNRWQRAKIIAEAKAMLMKTNRVA